jgi:EmrB/QacA subfamily drug resistance transporter
MIAARSQQNTARAGLMQTQVPNQPKTIMLQRSLSTPGRRMTASPANARAAASGGVDQLPPGIWKIVTVAAIGSFMAQLDATVVNVSLATLAKDLHVTLPLIQWVMSGYLLALALTLPLNGWLVSRAGAKSVYLWCFAAFSLSSLLCGLAWSAQSLIAFRILQGMSGGLLAPMAQMLVARAAGKHLPRVAAAMTMPILLAPLLGPVAAGAILQYASWRWLFLINLPVGIIAVILAATFLPDDRSEMRPRSLDLQGLALLSPGVALLLYSMDHLAAPIGAVSCAAAIILLAFYYRSARRKGDAALIDLRLLRRPVFAAAITTMFLLNGVAYAGQMLIPIYLVHSCGLSPSRAGWLLIPLGLGAMCLYPFMGRLTGRFGIRKLTNFGALLALAGTLPLIFLAGHKLQVAILVPCLFLRGAGGSAIGIPAMSAGYASVARDELPMATTALNIVQRLGGPTCTTLCAIVLGWSLPASGTLMAPFALLSALHAVLFVATLLLPITMK